jgi:GNAT superfamily N-acetyltransferase
VENNCNTAVIMFQQIRTYSMLINYHLRPKIENLELNQLFRLAWENHQETDFKRQLSHSLLWVCAYDTDRLIGFVNVAWDGGIHAFLLDTTVHPEYRRRGIGKALVMQAAQAAKAAGMNWLHVDYEPHLEGFYRDCGFMPTLAGLMNLRD